MADVPILVSKEQIVGNLIDGIRSRLRKDIDLNDGSNLSMLVEAVGQNLFKASGDIITMIDALNSDRATGEALQRQAADANVPVYSALSSYGQVSVTDDTFVKVSTTVYAGQPAPVAGSLTLYVTDASLFSSSGGKIYIGRGTTNVEGPLTYTSTTAVAGGAYWAINLAGTSPTTKFHNIGETVVFAQGGNRFIAAGTTVQTAQGASILAVSFLTTSGATIPDGEVTVSGVPVLCTVPGTIGNVSIGAISEIVGVPFTGTVNNPLAFNNGSAADTDQDIQERVEAYELAKSKATDQAIETAVTGLVALDELKKVSSANVFTDADNQTQLIFSDGQAYEPNFLGAPFETVVDSAVGGEINLQLRQIPVAQARIENTFTGPYPMSGGPFLSCIVEGAETTHQFSDGDFLVPTSGTALEVAASINGDININFSASTANNGANVVVYPRSLTSNQIEVVAPPSGTNSNAALGFPLNPIVTLRLYKNDLPLFEDGVVPNITTLAQNLWSSAISAGDTLVYQVDNTPAVTVTFTTAAFQAVEVSAVVSSQTSLSVWAQVCNDLMPGVVTTVVGNTLNFASARGASSKAALNFTGGTLLFQIFSTSQVLSSQGQTSDYTFNEWTGQIGLAVPLQPGDKVTAGSQFMRGNDLTTSMPSGPGVSGRAWIITDGDSESVPNGMSANTSITFSKTGDILTVSGFSPSVQPQGFNEVEVGDWLIVWANSSDPAPLRSNQGFWRVETVQTGVITVNDGPIVRSNLGINFIPLSNRIVVVRSTAPVQLLSFSSGPLTTFLGQIQAQLTGTLSDIEGSAVRLSTATFDPDGQLYVAAVDQGGSALGFTVGQAFDNTPSFYGFNSVTDGEVNLPSFSWSTLGTAVSDQIFDLPSMEALGGEVSDFLQILDMYQTSPSLADVVDTNKGSRSLTTFYDPSTTHLTMDVPLYMRAGQAVMNAGDRFFLRSGYKFYSDDTCTAIVDGNAQTESYVMPVARQILVSSASTPSTQDFSATDNQSSLALSSVSSFFDFDFSNFKIHRQARTVLTNGTYSIQFNSTDYGPSGNTVRVGLFYPPNVSSTSISSNFSVSDVVDAVIFLPVQTVRTPNWDFTTSFTVSKTTTGGADSLTYQWQSGTQPNFGSGSGGASVGVGDVAFISGTSDLLAVDENIRAQVTAVTPTSFTIKLPTGAYASDDVTFTNILNQDGTISVVTNVPHNLTTGQRVGFYDTASPNGSSFPFNTTYVVTVTGASSFQVPTPSAVPSALISSASLVSNVVTVTTSTNHNLFAGDVVLISGAGSPYDGLAAVASVTAPNQFTYVRSGSAASVATGEVDFQSYLPTTPVSISTVTTSGTLITVNTSSNHGLSPGNITTIAGISIGAWSSATTYGVGDVVSYLGQSYVSLQVSNTNEQPNTSPTWWAVTTVNLSGTFVVNSTPTLTQFTYFYQQAVGTNTTGTGGTSTQLIPSGSMARSIGGVTNENLQFAAVSTTAQQIVDYVSNTIPNQLVASVTNGDTSAVVDESTQDNQITSNYFTATVTSFVTFQTLRRAKVQLSAPAPAGSTITIAGMTGTPAAYNGTYVVIDTYLDTGLGYTVSVIQLESLATASAVYTPGGTVTGSLPMQMMYDGDNEVLTSNLQALSGFPMFTAKNAWTSVPAVGEQLRLVADSTEQMSRFWNELVVTGFSNVGDVELTRYGRELQLSTQTFGGSGSVQITGGTANSLQVAVVGSGAELTTKEGMFSVPQSLHKGFLVGQWVNLTNSVAQNKDIGFSEDTAVQLSATTLQITAGTGSFQTKRTATYNASTQFKVEKHGPFVAVVGVGGPSMDLIANGVQEGDWVRFFDTSETPWVSTTTYSVGSRVSFGTLNYTSLQNSNLDNEPDTSPAFWQVQQWSASNLGVYQVIRIFGNDTFWIDNQNPVEEVVTLGNAGNLSFYSYDSVMPGDVLVITTNVLGTQNIGRYTVLDQSAGPGYSFPTSTAIWITTVPNPPGSPVDLGGEFSAVNVQEVAPLSLWKRILAMGPGNGTATNVIVDSPNLTERITSSLGGQATAEGKLGFGTGINVGIDAYKYYVGLIAAIQKTIYGSPVDRINYPGWRAAGSPIAIVPATLKAVDASFAVRVQSGVPFTDILTYVQAAVAGYVNNLEVGESVSMSAMIAAALTVPGVTSCVITSPTFSASSDLIPVNANEQAYVINPTTDITVTLLT